MKAWDLPPPSSRPSWLEAQAARAGLRPLGSGRYAAAVTAVPDGSAATIPAPAPAPK